MDLRRLAWMPVGLLAFLVFAPAGVGQGGPNHTCTEWDDGTYKCAVALGPGFTCVGYVEYKFSGDYQCVVEVRGDPFPDQVCLLSDSWGGGFCTPPLIPSE